MRTHSPSQQHVPHTRASSSEADRIIADEGLLPPRLLKRLHAQFPQHSDLFSDRPVLFADREHGGRDHYSGMKGFHEVCELLAAGGIELGHMLERELFIDVYRFLVTRYTLNRIDWEHFQTDSIFHLVFPQPGMFPQELIDAYGAADDRQERRAIAAAYLQQTNPHDGHQLLNKPWFDNDAGELEIVHGSQHKYPPVQLIFDQSTQNCFSFCTYCFRHAQVRGDEDMFLQKDIEQVHRYLRSHTEVRDLLITGGDAGYLKPERFEAYTDPMIHDPALLHMRTVRLGSRVLSYDPEHVLSRGFERLLAQFDRLYDSGIQVALMAHFSTPAEVLHPLTIAAIRRLQAHHVIVRSQSPMIKHVGMFPGPDGHIDVERSAQNWIDLGLVLEALGVGFHSIYVPRPTGQWQYFTAPLAEIHPVFDRIFRALPSIARPSRHISMTTSAGKVSILGTVDVNGDKAFALKFSEGRNMAWIDRVFLAKYDTTTNDVSKLQPLYGERFFFADELDEIEDRLEHILGPASLAPQAEA